MPETLLSRPELILSLPVSEFDAGTWRKDELIAFAKVLGVPMKGTKAAVTARIRTQLLRRNPPTESVATGAVASSAAPPSLTSSVTPQQPTDFFRAEPGQSRAQALAAWFASRKAAVKNHD